MGQDFVDVGAAEAYAEGIIDFLRAVDGADMAALIREPPRTDKVPARKGSLRAQTDELDVSAIARKSGGGGHRQAAGFSSDRSVAEITDFIHREFVAASRGANGSEPDGDPAGAYSGGLRPRRQGGRPVVVSDRAPRARPDGRARRPRGHA